VPPLDGHGWRNDFGWWVIWTMYYGVFIQYLLWIIVWCFC
jgi:hypothetical protein